MTDPPDDLADMLAPQPGAPAPALRDTLLMRTERRLARDRWMRRAGRASAIAAVFLAGGAIGWFARTPIAHAPGSSAPDVVVVTVPLVVPVPTTSAPVANTPSTPVALSASEAELRAEQADTRTEAAKLYRLAGDTFLRDQDYANATRCYRLFLTRGGDSALSIDADDSWLLVSLKNAAFKEKTNVVPKTNG
jgi:hypothetical protein